MKKLLSATFALAFLLASPSALAALLYEYEKGPGNFGNAGLNDKQRAYNSITASYHTDGVLSFGTDFGAKRANGFWLVVNAGGNPKGIAGELAIFYGHLGSGKLYAYEYDGKNSANSWSVLGNQLEYFGKVIKRDGNAFNFSIDVSGINGRTDLGSDWAGAQFNDKVGIWYHPTWGTKLKSNPFSFSFKNQGWFDIANGHTTVTDVPEPGSVALFATGLLALLGLRRKRLV